MKKETEKASPKKKVQKPKLASPKTVPSKSKKVVSKKKIQMPKLVAPKPMIIKKSTKTPKKNNTSFFKSKKIIYILILVAIILGALTYFLYPREYNRVTFTLENGSESTLESGAFFIHDAWFKIDKSELGIADEIEAFSKDKDLNTFINSINKGSNGVEIYESASTSQLLTLNASYEVDIDLKRDIQEAFFTFVGVTSDNKIVFFFSPPINILQDSSINSFASNLDFSTGALRQLQGSGFSTELSIVPFSE